jgi:hypothetical protein
LAQPAPEPGVTLGLIEALTEDGSELAEIDQLLDQARTIYADDGFNTSATIDLQMRRAGPDEERRGILQRELVLTWVAQAERSEPLVRMVHLEKALRLARDYGIGDMVREIALGLHIPSYSVQRATTTGQYPGLGALLPEIQRRGLDESWFRFLNGFLARPMGDNVRNELLHGFVDDPPESIAVLVLVAVLFLAVGMSLGPK